MLTYGLGLGGFWVVPAQSLFLFFSQVFTENLFKQLNFISFHWPTCALRCLDYTPTSTEVDLRNNGSTGDYRFVDNNVHLIVAKITFAPAGNDTITAWLDPNVTQPEAGQNSATTYIGSVTGDLSFDRFFLRGGNNHQFEYDEIKFGTTWSSVLPVSNSASVPPPTTSSPFVADHTFGFFFHGSPGLAYSVLTTSNLSPANWQAIGSGTFGFDSVVFNEAITMNQPQRFYRVSIP